MTEPAIPLSVESPDSAYAILTQVRTVTLVHEDRTTCLTLAQFVNTELRDGGGTPEYNRWLQERKERQ